MIISRLSEKAVNSNDILCAWLSCPDCFRSKSPKSKKSKKSRSKSPGGTRKKSPSRKRSRSRSKERKDGRTRRSRSREKWGDRNLDRQRSVWFLFGALFQSIYRSFFFLSLASSLPPPRSLTIFSLFHSFSLVFMQIPPPCPRRYRDLPLPITFNPPFVCISFQSLCSL